MLTLLAIGDLPTILTKPVGWYVPVIVFFSGWFFNNRHQLTINSPSVSHELTNINQTTSWYIRYVSKYMSPILSLFYPYFSLFMLIIDAPSTRSAGGQAERSDVGSAQLCPAAAVALRRPEPSRRVVAAVQVIA